MLFRSESGNVLYELHREVADKDRAAEEPALYVVDSGNAKKEVARLTRAMRKAAEALEFEEAARLRDRIAALEKMGSGRK